jgi:hypothetical protein
MSIKHHYTNPETGSHWLLCKPFTNHTWGGIVIIPHLSLYKWCEIDKDDLDAFLDCTTVLPVFRTVKVSCYENRDAQEIAKEIVKEQKISKLNKHSLLLYEDSFLRAQYRRNRDSLGKKHDSNRESNILLHECIIKLT